MNKLKSSLKKAAAGAGLALVGAHAQAADWATVTGAVDFAGEITAVQAIVGVVAGVAVVMVGGRKVLSMIR